MKERPIPFSGEMVRAILAGTKSQTRRICKPQPLAVVGSRRRRMYRDADFKKAWETHPGSMEGDGFVDCPYGQPGDRLWVKESWAYRLDHDHMNGTELYAAGVRQAWYWADGPGKCCNTGCNGAAGRVRVARFMPRWASRITLEIIGVRVERLRQITGGDAVAEGYPHKRPSEFVIEQIAHAYQAATDWYRDLWARINGPGSWEADPFVWVIEFKRVEAT